MKERLTPWALAVGTVAVLVLLLAAPAITFWPEPEGAARWWGGMVLGLWIYLGFFTVGALVGGWFRRAAAGSWARGLGRVIGWIRLWHGWLVLIVGAGAVVGLLLFPVGGLLFGVDLPLARMALTGLRDGAFYALIWAPGISLVICAMLAYERSKAAVEGTENDPPS